MSPYQAPENKLIIESRISPPTDYLRPTMIFSKRYLYLLRIPQYIEIYVKSPTQNKLIKDIKSYLNNKRYQILTTNLYQAESSSLSDMIWLDILISIIASWSSSSLSCSAGSVSSNYLFPLLFSSMNLIELARSYLKRGRVDKPWKISMPNL